MMRNDEKWMFLRKEEVGANKQAMKHSSETDEARAKSAKKDADKSAELKEKADKKKKTSFLK